MTLLRPIASGVVSAVTSICISASQKYIEQAMMNSQHLNLKNIGNSLKNNTLTAKTDMTIGNELIVKPKPLQTLIIKSVNKALA